MAVSSIQGKHFSIGSALTVGWNLFKENAAFFLVLTIVEFCIRLAQNYISNNGTRGNIPETLLAILLFLVNIIFAMLMVKSSLETVDGKKPKLSHLLDGLSSKLVTTYVVTSIIVGILAVLGFFVLIIPGIIVILVYGMYPYVILDKNTDVNESMALAGKISKGIRVQLALFGFVALILNILGTIAFGIGLLITLPVTSLAMANIYRQLEKQTI